MTVATASREAYELAKRFALERIAPHARDWEATGFPREILREAAELGFAGLYVPAEFGGSDMSVLDAAAVFEGLGFADPSFAGYLSVHNMCSRIIAGHGSDAQKAEYLPRLVTMETHAGYCLTEEHGGSDPSAMRTRAHRSGDGFTLSGSKSFITGAGETDLYLVFCQDDEKRSLLLAVPARTKGVSTGESESKMGWCAQPTRQVFFSDVRVEAGALIGATGEGLRTAFSGLNVGRLNIAAAALGAAQRSLDLSVAYSSERITYGKPLSRRQVIRFKLADMEMQLQAARSLLYDAAARGDAGDARFAHFAAIAKAFVTERAFHVIDEALQLHGGYGYMAEYGIEKLLRDVRVHRILEGTNEMMRVIVARTLLGREDSH